MIIPQQLKNHPGLKKIIALALFSLFFFADFFAQPLPGSYYDFLDATKGLPAGHDKTQLIIYRPQNNGTMNDIRCFLHLEDESGNDVTYDQNFVTATYEWTSSAPDVINKYKKTYWLSGGLAMHLKLRKGKYKITVYTPTDQQNNWTYPEAGQKPFEWKSNVFAYDTENPAKVIFVTPTANENGFYDGGWNISSKAPRYLKNRAVPGKM